MKIVIIENQKELAEFERLHAENSSFPLPDLTSPLYCIQKLIYEDDKVIGSYLLHLTSEVSLILDKELPSLTKAKIIKQLESEIVGDCTHYGINDTHVFVDKDPSYEEFLVKNLGFKKATGTCLYRGIEPQKEDLK